MLDATNSPILLAAGIAVACSQPAASIDRRLATFASSATLRLPFGGEGASGVGLARRPVTSTSSSTGTAIRTCITTSRVPHTDSQDVGLVSRGRRPAPRGR